MIGLSEVCLLLLLFLAVILISRYQAKRICPDCGFVVRSSASTCPDCKRVFGRQNSAPPNSAQKRSA